MLQPPTDWPNVMMWQPTSRGTAETPRFKKLQYWQGPVINPAVVQADQRGELLYVNVDLCAGRRHDNFGAHSAIFILLSLSGAALVDSDAKECTIFTALKRHLHGDEKGTRTYGGSSGDIANAAEILQTRHNFGGDIANAAEILQTHHDFAGDIATSAEIFRFRYDIAAEG